MREKPVWLALLVPAALIAFGSYFAERARRRKALFQWASDSGLEILTYRQPLLTELSPFPFSGSKAQCVFYFEARESSGARRSGWVRLGDMWRGLGSKVADVRWVG